MTKQTAQSVVGNVKKAVKISVVVGVVALALFGAYVFTNSELRNVVIDHAQGQESVASKVN